ncbi:uncharacterized protein LOC135390102 isoform X2 [Ornithodoros turicata]|uniref:uncharacterized protein LOC135390102 isoform X2 n=1 Tax=Ornithodoros turicata TaxID=34597 RepID=UPI00313939AF
MYALVRCLNTFKGGLHTVAVRDIQNFHPRHDADFNNKTVYKVPWKRGDKSGVYRVQVLMMAANKAELILKQKNKRVLMPKLNTSACDGSPEAVLTEKQLKRKEEKSRRKNECESRKKMYSSILKKHIAKMKSENQAADSYDAATEQELSECEVDETPFGNANAIETAVLQCSPRTKGCAQTGEEAASLLTISKAVEDCQGKLAIVEEKLDKVLEELHSWSRIDHIPAHLALTNDLAVLKKAPEPSWSPASGLSLDDQATLFSTPQERVSHRMESHVPFTASTPEVNELHSAETELEPPPPLSDLKPFSLLDSNRFHLKDGVVVSANLLDRLHKLKEPRKVIRETAQAIWGNEDLLERTVGGRLAPKDRKNVDKLARRGLTPQKVDAIAATVRYWAGLHKDLVTEKEMDIRGTLNQMSTILSMKIQDVRKTAKRKLKV